MKIGLDIHGVIDKHPFLRDLAMLLVGNGHEVHVITGAPLNAVSDGYFTHDGIQLYLESFGYVCGKHYTHFYSIVDHHRSIGTNVYCDANGCWLDNDTWMEAKAMYCRENSIDLHIDDSESYAKLFTTPVAVIR